MTNRPLVMTLIIQNRLEELKSALRPSRDYSNGACSGSNTELFFSDDVDDIDQALAICRECPLRLVCLEDALEFDEYGIWGGMTESMRQQMKTERILSISSQVGTDLPDLEEVAYEVKGLLSNPVSKLCMAYKVEPRTIFRWREEIRSSDKAMELVRSVTNHG